ncbi:UNKNOWN [Stylonychia lemnae]|uniref:Uncharacterized protein n=1 Tax=Stylonychia lemnae TaxID=5949 RepID=A0A078A153_STYLE|nr:UNKNOWN [Stylonychia lemnae]|eukprot:CDW74509.1 UNKNOWN [Stylonychia lemnae]
MLEVKIAFVGGSDSGKSSLVKFLKICNYEVENQADKYSETWGISVNYLEWEHHNPNLPLKNYTIRFGLWESGGSFLKKFPFYNQYLLKNANLIVYMVSLASDENLLERLQNLVTQTREQWNKLKSQENIDKMREVVLLTKADLGYIYAQQQIQEIQGYCTQQGIEKCQILSIPYNERPDKRDTIVDDEMFDKEGDLVNPPLARHTLSSQFLDSISEICLKY